MLKVRQIKLEVSKHDLSLIKAKVAQKLKVNVGEITSIKISKEAIDARKKENVYYVFECLVTLKNESKIKESNDVIFYEEKPYQAPSKGSIKLNGSIYVVGSGPAGLFASYLLCENGYKVIILERGKKVEERIKDVENFWQNGKLLTNSNVQFGEGGAGTFSDGKLNTLIKDKEGLSKKVKDIFVLCGAPKEISYVHNPHIGTDNLRIVIKNMREKIIAMGGEFRFNTTLTDLIIKDNKLKGIIVNEKEEISCENLILAIGHSARDTFRLLLKNKVNMAPKPFAVGIRIMHPQALINENQYCKFQKFLPPASYKLTTKVPNGRSVYSFCMCPGGFVVNASSENNRLAINGMSNYKRDSGVANSAIIVNVGPDDFGYDTLDGMHFQELLEKKAYEAGGGKIPLQRLEDYFLNRPSKNIDNSFFALKGNYVLTNIRSFLPDFINEALIDALKEFEKKIPGFANPNAVLAIIESRSSSPVTIKRDEALESNISGIYPAGEGAGYAGGITTSAIDGLKVAEALIKKYYYEEESNVSK